VVGNTKTVLQDPADKVKARLLKLYPLSVRKKAGDENKDSTLEK
jgi:hypothetical protein